MAGGISCGDILLILATNLVNAGTWIIECYLAAAAIDQEGIYGILLRLAI